MKFITNFSLMSISVVVLFVVETLLTKSVLSDIRRTTSGLCHDEKSPYYKRLVYYDDYDTMQNCIDDGGLPYENNVNEDLIDENEYSRDKFGEWLDPDNDCVNTRHHLLLSTSTVPVDMGDNPCTVETGKWYDPYSNKVFFKASDVDIDHIVPLKWAWRHGADTWVKSQRTALANDPLNLIAVSLHENRSKGADGPDEWLPPNIEYRCQYILRFMRIVKKYKLILNNVETTNYRNLTDTLCNK